MVYEYDKAQKHLTRSIGSIKRIGLLQTGAAHATETYMRRAIAIAMGWKIF
jgi:hypothetical protein